VEVPVTATLVAPVTEFVPLVAVRIYVVVTAGLTDVAPLVPTAPMPLIVAPVALDVVQLNTAEAPGLILDGEAENDIITGSPEAGVPLVPATVSSAVDMVEPALLLAVKIYVVVDAGAIFSAPVEAAAGIPGSMLTEEAFCTSQESMAASPGLMEVGLTVNLTTTGALFAAPPPISTVMQPDAASNSNMAITITFLINTSSEIYLETPPSYYDSLKV